jgi:hypothetical protein
MAADSVDHFIPQSFASMIQDIGNIKNKKKVPCCRECNSTAGSKVFLTVKEKRDYIHNRYRTRYKKLLEAPDWSDKEIESLGFTIQSHVKRSIEGKKIMKERLRWPRQS